MSVGGIGALGVSENTKVWLAPGGMSTGASGVPVGTLVAGLVLWKLNVAGTPVAKVSRHPVARPGPRFKMVAKALAGEPICTERLPGSTAATIVWAAAVAEPPTTTARTSITRR